MCMKDHKIYRPKELTKKEREFIEQQEKKELLAAMIIIVLGAIVVTLIIKALIKALEVAP